MGRNRAGRRWWHLLLQPPPAPDLGPGEARQQDCATNKTSQGFSLFCRLPRRRCVRCALAARLLRSLGRHCSL